MRAENRSVDEELSRESRPADGSGQLDTLHEGESFMKARVETLEELVSQISAPEIEETLGQTVPSNSRSRLASPFNGLGRNDPSKHEWLVCTMWIVPEGVTDSSGYKRRFGKLDTGAHVSITYEDVLEGLGMDYHHVPCDPCAASWEEARYIGGDVPQRYQAFGLVRWW